jgi:heme ABC exporter ATP-binding subunit CcmA
MSSVARARTSSSLKGQDSAALDVLRAQGLALSYNGRPALQGASLEVANGEIVALLGPNGAGKSTLLLILAGVLEAQQGTAEVGGVKLPGNEDGLPKVVGFVPQGESLYPELTVKENLQFFARLHGIRGKVLRARTEELLKQVALTDRANQRAGDLSGGLRQRLALAASLVHDPQVLLLDEPGTGLDPIARDRLADVMRAHRNAGKAILLSTHSFEEARRVADRVILLGKGRVIATVPAAQTPQIEARFRAMETLA